MVTVTTDIAEVVEGADVIVIAVSSAGIHDIVAQLKPLYKKDQIICNTTKGIDPETGLFMHEIIQREIDTDKICILSGPSFAKDIMRLAPISIEGAANEEIIGILRHHLPEADDEDLAKILKNCINSVEKEIVVSSPIDVTIAGDETSTGILKRCFHSDDKFRIQRSTDVIGTACWGSLKNSMAIATGIMQAHEDIHDNTLAMFHNKGGVEIAIIAYALGGTTKDYLDLIAASRRLCPYLWFGMVC